MYTPAPRHERGDRRALALPDVVATTTTLSSYMSESAVTLDDRVLVTGGNGYIGSAVIRALKRAGFKHVAGLVRRAQPKVQAATDAGADDVIAIQTLEGAGLRHLVGGFTAVIHTATSTGDGEFDAAANREIIDALPTSKGTRCVYIYTSGNLVCGEQDMSAGEDAPLSAPLPFAQWRVGVEAAALEPCPLLRSVVVRPGFVYGGSAKSDHVVREWLEGALSATKRAEVVGDGANAMALVHVDDLAALYVLLLRDPSARGVFHACSTAASTATSTAAATTRELATACSEAAGGGGEITLRAVADAEGDDAYPRPRGFAQALAIDQRRFGCAKSIALGWSTRPFDAAAALAEMRAAEEAAAAFAELQAAAERAAIEE